ncbi:MAG: hypothetical protein AB7F59_12625 [Bdellovibrionales bacterium]
MKKMILMILMMPVFTLASGQEKGGGETEKLKFAIVANKVLFLIKTHRATFPEVDLLKLTEAVKSTTIKIVSQELFVGNEQVTATNNPVKKIIEVNRFKWRGLNGQPTLQATLVAHEYFGILKLTDSNGQISNRIAALVGTGTGAFFRWSCSASVAGSLVDRLLDRNGNHWYEVDGNSYIAHGEGDTSGEAWSELVDTAKYWFDPKPFHLLTSHVQDKNTSYFATMMNSCRKND